MGKEEGQKSEQEKRKAGSQYISDAIVGTYVAWHVPDAMGSTLCGVYLSNLITDHKNILLPILH